MRQQITSSSYSKLPEPAAANKMTATTRNVLIPQKNDEEDIHHPRNVVELEKLRTEYNHSVRTAMVLRKQLEEKETNEAKLRYELVSRKKTTSRYGNWYRMMRNCTSRVAQMELPNPVPLRYRDTSTDQHRQVLVHAEYSGQVLKYKPHGAGIMRFNCGDLYVGMFENGEMNGEGSYISNRNGSKSILMKGQFNHNEYQEGRGRTRSRQQENKKRTTMMTSDGIMKTMS